MMLRLSAAKLQERLFLLLLQAILLRLAYLPRPV